MTTTQAPRLRSPLCRIVLDGAEFTVQTSNPDLVRWERTRVRHSWPSAKEAPQLWATFVSWAAAKRLGLTDLTFDQFEATADEAMPVGDDRGDRALTILRAILDDDEASETLGAALVDQLAAAAMLLDPEVDDAQVALDDDQAPDLVDPTRRANGPDS